MAEYRIEENTVLIDGSRIEFGNPIAEVVEFPGSVIVRLELTGDVPPEMQRNVIAVDTNGEERWRIQKNPGFDRHTPYSNIRKKGEQLWAYHPTGMDYRIDVDSGAIVDKEFKR